MTLDLDPDRFAPIGAQVASCLEGPQGVGFRTAYEVVEFVPLDSLPDRVFESSEVGIDSTPAVETTNADSAANGGRRGRAVLAASFLLDG
ncbi:MAG: hypothetical protein GEU80_04950 [Dehalococcoidia bacterium]|nr:hypothetical protein [Dehalococcoidia bacterium]